MLVKVYKGGNPGNGFSRCAGVHSLGVFGGCESERCALRPLQRLGGKGCRRWTASWARGPLLHAAEGHLSGHALASAAEAAGLPVLHVAPESTVGEGIATAASFALISAPPTPGSPQTV